VQSVLGVIEVAFFTIANVCFYAAILTWNFVLLITGVACLWAAYEVSDTSRFLSGSETRWNALIGAGGFFTEIVNRRVFSCGRDLNTLFHVFARGQITSEDMQSMRANLFADPNCYQVIATPVLFPINNQSDGLFHAGAARIPEDPNSIDHVVNLEVEHANHQELVNHSNMTVLFEAIFAGRTKANLFFVTR
jgi:hypothetical protein